MLPVAKAAPPPWCGTDGIGVVTITGLLRRSECLRVYNLRVLRLHNYAVGRAGVLVHNDDCPPLDDVAPKRTPSVGGGAKLENLTAAEQLRVQNAADRLETPITVVGSRAKGTAGATSDWDFVINANHKKRHSAASSLPEGPRLGIDARRNQDIFKSNVATDEPHITFFPSGGGSQ